MPFYALPIRGMETVLLLSLAGQAMLAVIAGITERWPLYWFGGPASVGLPILWRAGVMIAAEASAASYFSPWVIFVYTIAAALALAAGAFMVIVTGLVTTFLLSVRR